MTDYTFAPIAKIHSCFKEKFGIPRQPNLVKDSPSFLVFEPEFAKPEAVRELEGFSHIWLIFVFHQSEQGQWQAMVRPPRLGGNKKVGVFASRSPFRPNPVGMSAVRLESIELTDHGPVLHLKGADLLDQTPVLDIKPYLPYSDIIPEAVGGFAPLPPASDLCVEFSSQAMDQCREREKEIPGLIPLITQVLEQDPRPAYYDETRENSQKIFGIRLFDFDLKWTQRGQTLHVICLDPSPSS